ncbi:DXO1 [Candida theae]|uniref:Decapping nuclease n=1 Tax=Candida theae TaxID=1198502 RepID=A0AAD5BAB1_9ASCO|nr:DXO1 [Candida theae]KAI5948619.1 DXO1 [Candida theae]
MLDKIRLSVFDNIVNGVIGNDEDLIKALKKTRAFARDPEELCHYTKDDAGIKFADTGGLEKVKISFSRKETKKKNVKSERNQPIIGACLSKGFDRYTSPDLNNVYSLQDLFKAIKYLIESRKLSRDKLRVVTTRRHLMKLMCIPLNKQPVDFDVIYWRGLVIFAYNWDEEVKLVPDNIQKMLQYSGYQFEKVVTGKTSRDNASSFYTVTQHSVDAANVIYSAEIDCAIAKEPGLQNYVELKTHSTLLDDKLKTANKLQRKLMALYCQNKFISCNYSAMGFRSQDFRLASLKKYTEHELVGLLDKLPIFLTHSCSLKTKHIFQWYNLVISWLCQRHFDDNEKPHVFKLRFERKDELMDSHLAVEPVSDDEAVKTFNKLVPEWFQNFY